MSARRLPRIPGETTAFSRAAPLLVVVVGSAVGLAIALLHPDLRLILLGALTVVLVGPLIARLSHFKFDLFEPLVVANLAMLFMFVVRPAADLVSGRTDHLGYDILPSFDRALLIALVGSIAFQIGYLTPLGRRVSRRAPTPPRELHAGCASVFGVGILVLGIGLFGLFVIQTGGTSTIRSLLSGVQPSQNDLYLNSTGYFYRGLILAAPASLILFSLVWSRRLRLSLLPVIAGILAVATLSVVDGNRLTLLLVLGPPLLLWYLMRNRRPGLVMLLLAGYIFMTVGIGFLRDIRIDTAATAGSRLTTLAQAVVDPGRQAEAMVLGADNEMFDSLANELLMVPSSLPYQHGATISDLAIRAVPRPLWPSKPLESNDAVVNTLWPLHYASSRASPAFSILGPLYADSGWITVVIGMLAFGIACSALWHYFQSYRQALPAQMIYAICLPLIVALLRGSLPDTLSYVPFTLLPLLIVIWMTGRSRVSSPNRQPDVRGVFSNAS